MRLFYWIAISFINDEIRIIFNNVSKKVVVYPAMCKAPIDDDTIYISDAYIKFAKPYALRKLTSN